MLFAGSTQSVTTLLLESVDVGGRVVEGAGDGVGVGVDGEVSGGYMLTQLLTMVTNKTARAMPIMTVIFISSPLTQMI